MATLDDVRQFALTLPGAMERTDEFRFDIELKGKLRSFVHLWRERIHPKKPKVPNFDVLVLSVPSLRAKEEMLAAHSNWLFTESHYDGYASILVRLPDVPRDELGGLIKLSWQCASKSNVV